MWKLAAPGCLGGRAERDRDNRRGQLDDLLSMARMTVIIVAVIIVILAKGGRA
jgi:hypothetical protein